MKQDVIVAGYLCLDIIPEIYPDKSGQSFSYKPGNLIEIGKTELYSGGAVANTGLALHKLGLMPKLIGKVGNDAYADTLNSIFAKIDPQLNDFIVKDENAFTGYTFILNPPGTDRMFMVHTGANKNLSSADIPDSVLDGVRLFHFGYPPLLYHSYRNNGDDTKELFKRARQCGAAVSLDMSLPDSNSEAGQVDWNSWFNNVLPEVDIFLPSLDELVFMIDGKEYTGDKADSIDYDILHRLSGHLIEKGVAVVCMKMGHHGIYVRTTDNADRLAKMGGCSPQDVDAWCNKEVIAPCFEAKVRGATGAGDCTIAGFLAGVLKGFTPGKAAALACGVGSCNVEAPDAFSGLMDFESLQKRMAAGWVLEDEAVDKSSWCLTDENVYARK